MDNRAEKREHYRKCFHNFDPIRVAKMGPEEVEKLVLDSGIIRHRGKIQAIITNAQAYLAMEANGEDFSRFIWGFVDGEPKINHWWCLAECPATTPISDAMSKALKNVVLSLSAPLFAMPLCRPVAW